MGADNKENAVRRSYAAQLQRKQAAASNNGGGAAVPLPRVAALASSIRASQQRSPLGKSGRRPGLSSTTGQTFSRPATSSVHRVGFKPATHSTRSLVPLLDVTAPVPPSAPASAPASAASQAPAPVACSTPVLPSSPLSSILGDPGLDDVEAELQAELALADRRLELLHQQQSQRRSATPDVGGPRAGSALSVGALTPPQQLRPASQQQLLPSLPEPPMGQGDLQQHQQAGVEDLVPPAPQLEPPPVPLADQSIVRCVITATGTGCKDVIASHTAAPLAAGACWTTRGHRVLHLESSSILQLWGRRISDVTLRITFADAASVPRLVRLEHAPSPTAAFERLGDIMLQAKSLKQLRHLFRLGKSLEVQRFLRITLVGHMAEEHSGAHRVSHMLLTSAQGPQRAQSALSNAPAPVSVIAASPHASVNHGKPQETPTADSAASGTSQAALAKPAAAPGEAAESVAACLLPAPLDDALPPSGCAGTPALTMPADACSPAAQPVSQAVVVANTLGAVVHTEPAAAAPVEAWSPAVQTEQAAVHASLPAGPVSVLAACSAASSYAASSTSESSFDEQEQPQLSTKPSQEDPLSRKAEGSVWGTLEDVADADVDFVLLAAEFGGARADVPEQQQEPRPLPSQQQQHRDHDEGQRKSVPQAAGGSAAPSLMLLPMQRCINVDAVLSELELAPQQATAALLGLLEPAGQAHSPAAELTDAQVERLLECLPSADERALLAGFDGHPEQLGVAEQLMLELMHVPALRERVDACRFASQAAARIEAAGEAAAILGAACSEVVHSDLLRTLLKVALLAGNFLNAGNQNGAAAGFQIDALLKLKDVRSSRARTRTLLHFVAREVARQHADGACLKAALPSAASAAGLDVAAARADLLELTAGARRLEEALAAPLHSASGGGSMDAAGTAHLSAFRTDVVERLAALLGELDDAEGAFRHLGSFINGQRATLADPRAFFGVLHAFAEELQSAHEENAQADAAAGASAKASMRSKDGKPCRQGEGPSPPASLSGSLDLSLRRLRNTTGGNVQEGGSRASLRASQEQQSTAAPDKAVLLERLKQASLDRLACPASEAGAAEGADAARPRKQHSPQPCMSRAAIAGIGGSRRGMRSTAGSCEADQHGGSSPPAVSSVDAAALLAQAGSLTGPAGGGAPAKLSTPVASLLRESARLINSFDCGESGFGSDIASAAAGASSHLAAEAVAEEDTAAAEDGTAATPDGTVRPAEEEPGYSTPRGAVSVQWLGHQQQLQQSEAGAAQQQQGQQQPQAAAIPAAQLERGQLRYTASTEEAEVPADAEAALARAEQLAASNAGSLSARGSQGVNLSQLRHRSLQQLSPTSTPLSSLGRQSSHCSSAYSSDCGGNTPRSSLRLRGSALRRSTSPLGLGTSVAQAEAQAAQQQQQAHAGSPAPAESAEPPHAAQGVAAFQPAPQPAPAQGGGAAIPASTGSKGAAEHEMALPAREFGALHSRASSCDLTYYAPFSMDREGASAFAAPGQQGLSASFSYEQDPVSAWGPLLAAQQGQQLLRPSTLLRHTSADEGMLAGAATAAAASRGRVPKRVAFSMPSSPRAGGAADVAGLGRRPPPLNLRGLTDRLQMHADRAAVQRAPREVRRSGSSAEASQPQREQQQHIQQQQQQWRLDPVLEMLASVPTPRPPPLPELAADDLADLAGFSSDHEAEWQQLALIEQQDAEWQRQQQAEREAGELLLAQLPAVYGSSQQALQGGAEARADGDEAEQLAALAMLPSPINSSTSNLDAAVARLLASAGNTPTGPLGLGMRCAPADMFAGAAAAQAGAAPAAGLGASQASRQVNLLEPVMPAPLGEGVRASHTMSSHVPAAALRMSVEGPRAMLRHPLAAAPQQTTAEEVEQSAAAAAAAAAEGSMDDGSVLLLGGGSSFGGFGNGSMHSGGGDWGAAGCGPARRRGLRKYLSGGRHHY